MKNPAEAGRSVPSFAEKAINFIEKNGWCFNLLFFFFKMLNQLSFFEGLEIEGIFRLSGSARDIDKMKDQLDRGKGMELDGQDCHAIAGLLKLWLREMPEPLLTYDLYDNWIACASMIPFFFYPPF